MELFWTVFWATLIIPAALIAGSVVAIMALWFAMFVIKTIGLTVVVIYKWIKGE